MNDMTPQEIFDKVVNHLRAQGEQSRGGMTGGCAYRGRGGMMCAAGCLIPDSEYASEMEGKRVSAVPYFDGFSSLELIGRLQDAHDGGTPGEGWEQTFKLIAFDFDLTYTPVSEAATNDD